MQIPDPTLVALLAAGMLVAAFLYASVGHGGASGRFSRLDEVAIAYAFAIFIVDHALPDHERPARS